MLLDIKDSPLAEYINDICKESGVNPQDDVFAESSLGKKGFSIRYNELLAIAIVHNWDPAYNKNAKNIINNKKNFNQFLKDVNLLEGTAPKTVLIEYLRLVKIFFKHELIITNFLESQRIYLTIEKIANSDLPTCIFGETGTGKEFVANIIHKLSKMKSKKGKFIVLNCAGMPDHLLHREVFGYAKSAFPGATEDHDGYIAVANGGTLFLDEIGASGELFQKSMLRFLNDGSYNRLGDPLERKSKCRIICTTKTSIQNFQKKAKDNLRSDFYHRITGHIIYLPPLKHVRSNIPLLILLFSLATAKKFGYTDTVVFPGILLKFWITGEQWKGNYRQLKNSVGDYVTKFIHLEKKGGYKIDRPFYDIVPLSGKWFKKNPLYILNESNIDSAPYNRLFNLVDGHAILPFLKKLSIGEKAWNNLIIDLLHMVTNPYLHYALFQFNKKTGKCDYDTKSYVKYTNFRIITGHEEFDAPPVKTDSPIRVKTPRKPKKEKDTEGKTKTEKSNNKKVKYSIEKYSGIEANITINDLGKQVVENSFILTPKSSKTPPLKIDDFLNTQTQEFSLLLFLIYERSLGKRDWLSAILSPPEKYPSEFESLKTVLGWCGIEYSVSNESYWWNYSDNRRWIVKSINEKAVKAGSADEIIELMAEPRKNAQEKPKKKRIGRKSGSYTLLPDLQTKINFPPSK